MGNDLNRALKTGAIAASLVGSAILTAYTTTKYLIKVALNREPPKGPPGADKLLTGSDAAEDIPRDILDAIDRLEHRENETVVITAHDGTPLAGHLIGCEDPKRLIIAMHGWRSTWCRDFGLIADFWHDSGCAVLYAEQRGQGESGGEYMGFGLTERYDCLDWVRFATERFGETLPIYLAGISMGATTVLMAAGLGLPKNVHGIMADCGFTSPDAIWNHVASDNLHLPFGLYRGMASEMCKKRINFGSGDYSTTEALANSDVPVLLIHGTDDNFVPVEMTFENYKAARGPRRLFVVPGADHGMSCYADREGYESAVLAFWRDFDGARQEAAPAERPSPRYRGA